MKEKAEENCKITLSHEEKIGNVHSKITATWSGVTSIQDANAFLIAALTAIKGMGGIEQVSEVSKKICTLQKSYRVNEYGEIIFLG